METKLYEVLDQSICIYRGDSVIWELWEGRPYMGQGMDWVHMQRHLRNKYMHRPYKTCNYDRGTFVQVDFGATW